MEFLSTAQEEAEKINDQTGAGYVTDQSFWERQGIHTGEDLAISVLGQTYSDYYKEVHGFRPRHRLESIAAIQSAIHNLDLWVDEEVEQEKIDIDRQVKIEKERQELADLMPGEFDLEHIPTSSGMGRRTENKIMSKITLAEALGLSRPAKKINNKGLQKLILSEMRIILEEEEKEGEEEEGAEWDPGDKGPEEELEAWMDTPLASLPANPAESLSDEAQELVDHGVKDGDTDDDKKIAGGGGAADIPLSGLKASQNEVGMKQSLANVLQGKNATWDGIDWGDVDWLVAAMKPGATITFADALLGATTSDGDVVLDGHHRWSQATMVNPDGNVNIILSKAGGLSADEVLKAVHLAILKKTGSAQTKSASGGNLFSASAADVKGHLDASERKVDPKTHKPSEDGVAPYIAAVMEIAGIEDVEDGEAVAIERVMGAIKSLGGRIVGGAPDRTKMPQADGETNPITGAEAAAALDSGGVNYAAPFVKETRTHESDQLIMERWNKLAGIL